MDFVEFPKIARYSREVIVTEKIDGTNAAVVIDLGVPGEHALATIDGCHVYAQSRTRFINTDQDNFGFAKWVQDNAPELVKLGVGRHFGEWYGSGIQRNYGLTEKRFALFNTTRWNYRDGKLPKCVWMVPELFRGNRDFLNIEYIMDELAKVGSVAVPGFMRPEGIVIYHTAAGIGFKKTIEKDDSPKSLK